MKVKSTIPSLLMVFICAIAMPNMSMAQDYLGEYTWDDQDWFSQVKDLPDKDVQILYRDKANEFSFDPQDNLMETYFFRSVVYLNSQEAVDDYNKLYINISNAIKLVEYNARVLYRSKSTRSLGKDALKEGKTEDGDIYNYFAIEGAEVGCIVDYYFVMTKNPSYDGVHAIAQMSDPIAKFRHRIISPNQLVFQATPHIGNIEVNLDTNDTTHRVLVVSVNDLPGLESEGFSNLARTKCSYFYKLTDNFYNNSRNLFTYGTVSQRVYENINEAFDKKTLSVVSKFLKKAEVDEKANDRTKVLQIENYLKGNIGIVDVSNPSLSDIPTIISNKVCSQYGMTKLMYGAFKLYDIPVEIVLTTSRYDVPFPDSLENYAVLDEYVFYFPTFNDYSMPSVQLYRVGIIPYGYIYNHGLFIREVKVGDFKTGAGKIKFIDAYPKDHSVHDMYIDVQLNDDATKAVVKMKEVMTGYNALNYQPYYDYISADKLQEHRESSVKQVSENAEILSVTVENEGVDQTMINPFIIHSEYENEHLIELAGNKLLFKIGELIGPQAEMYQESARALPVENTYLHGYHREINFTIPEGYKCSNLDDLNMDVTPFEENHTLFTSTYTMEGNVVKVVVEEYYDKMVLPLEEYEAFRSVINAAANFNKITLVLEEV